MDTKHTVDAFGIHEICQKLQELGEQVHALSERSTDIVTSAREGLSFHAKSIWLFTYSDLKTIVGPETAFGILSALSGPILTNNQSPDLSAILARTPRVAFWCWINLLPFAIDNQRQPEAIEEDAENKPWRPMPSGRMSQTQAKWLMRMLYIAAIVASLRLGGLKQCLTLIFLGWWYNHLGGADHSCITRNFINACGFLSYATGATEVASRTELLGSAFNAVAWPWFLVVGAVVFTSVQTQDMYDQAGDGLRGRKTVPLEIGDHYARWSIAIAMAVWSVACPTFWQLGLGTYTLSMVTAAIITFRTLTRRSVSADKLTFRIWNLWMVPHFHAHANIYRLKGHRSKVGKQFSNPVASNKTTTWLVGADHDLGLMGRTNGNYHNLNVGHSYNSKPATITLVEPVAEVKGGVFENSV